MASPQYVTCTLATQKDESDEISIKFEITYILYCKSPFEEVWEKNWSYYSVKDAMEEARYQYNSGGQDVLVMKIPTNEIKYYREHTIREMLD